MKIKEVCATTGLTDRAVRFYVEKGLLTPQSNEVNGRIYYEYSEEDVELLKVILTLRRAGFCIEEILHMQKRPELIDRIVRKRGTEMQAEAVHTRELSERLKHARKNRPEGFFDIFDLAEEIQHMEMLEGKSQVAGKDAERKLPELKLEFGKFDAETEEEKERMYEAFIGRQYVRNKVRAPFERLEGFLNKFGLGTAKVFMTGIGIAVAIVFVMGLLMLIPRSLASFCPWDEMDEQNVWVRYGRWEWSVSTDANYKQDAGTYPVGSEGYNRLKELLHTTKCSGFIQSLFPKDGYTVSGAQESIHLDVAYKTDDEWQWKSYSIYSNGTMLVSSNGGMKVYYLDWFGREDCDRFFEEVKAVLKECESEEDFEEIAGENAK